MADTKFDAAWWDIWEMRKQANKIAKEEGISSKEEIDSFRHAYTSAKVAEKFDKKNDIWFQIGTSAVVDLVKKMFSTNVGIDMNDGKTIAKAMGLFNEIPALWDNKDDHGVDLKNNEIGLQIRDEVERDVSKMRLEWNLNDDQAEEWRQRLLKTRIAEAVKDGKLSQ